MFPFTKDNIRGNLFVIYLFYLGILQRNLRTVTQFYSGYFV